MIDGKVVSCRAPLEQLTAFQRAAMDWWAAGKNRHKAIEEVEDGMRYFPGDHNHPNYKLYAEELEVLKSTINFHDRVHVAKGNVYHVQIIPDDDQFLLWDAPMSKQPESVKRHLVDIKTEETGGEVYKQLSQKLGSDKAASIKLDQIGIPGIRYLDGKSRRNGSGHYNYVIFDDRHVGIVNDTLRT